MNCGITAFSVARRYWERTRILTSPINEIETIDPRWINERMNRTNRPSLRRKTAVLEHDVEVLAP